MDKKEIILGIDLGTTYSCVGIWKNTKIVIIPNDIGERTTPSVVCFTENERLIGKAAKNNNKNYKNKIYDSKRLIGRNFEDKEIQEDKLKKKKTGIKKKKKKNLEGLTNYN